jgi:hypothetical protein
MMENPKRCTDSEEEALGLVDEILYRNQNIKLAKQITRDVFSKIGQTSSTHSFSIKCYVTKTPDIRFCIDRDSDCLQRRTMTNFLVIRPTGEIHVIDIGKPYLRRQKRTKFYIISTKDVLKLPYENLWEHIKNSFCSRIKQYSLQSSLCK